VIPAMTEKYSALFVYYFKQLKAFHEAIFKTPSFSLIFNVPSFIQP
jgi:hypothetical protein